MDFGACYILWCKSCGDAVDGFRIVLVVLYVFFFFDVEGQHKNEKS